MSNSYPDLPNTKFPDQVDDFPRMRDITASEVVLMEQYQAFIKAKDITSAQNLIEANPGLKVVLLNAFNVNNVGDAIKALERFFDSNVNGYILQKQQEFQSEIDKFDDKEDYNPTTPYFKNNMVRNNGFGYIILKDNILGITPTDDGINYRQFTLKGEKGNSGSGLTPRGIFNGITPYVKDDLSIYDNKWWVANQSTTGNLPSFSSIYWDLYLDLTGITAGNIITTDTNNYYTSDNLEGITQEIGSRIAKIGTDPLETTAQDLSSAVNEVVDKITILNGSGEVVEKVSKSVYDTHTSTTNIHRKITISNVEPILANMVEGEIYLKY